MLPERLLKNRHVTDGDCWEWTAARTVHGYGRVRWQGHVRRVHRVVAHLVYELNLDDPAQRALHRCDNPPCFNPDHLYVGTQSDNVADMVARGRARGGDKPHQFCNQGHALSGDNILRRRTGARRCRECARAANRAYRQRRTAREGAYWRRSKPFQTLGGEA